MRDAVLAALFFGFLSGSSAWAAEDVGKSPFDLVRELQILQDRAVLKGEADWAEYRKQIANLGGRLSAFSTHVWADPKNARAAVVYVLSGGDPSVLRRLLGSGVTLGIDSKLVKAALAYGERQDAKATELFEEIDMDQIDESIVGHVALVRAVLISAKDQAKGLALLDMARIMASGTIVEEAALRREAILSANTGKLEEFEAFSSQYFRRFSKSKFASRFGHDFAREVVTGRYAGDEKRLSKLGDMLRGLEEVERREACLLIAEQGVAAVNVEMVRFAAKIAADLFKDKPADAMRLRLYEAAALVVTEDAGEGASALMKIDKSQLDARDLGLLRAALAVAREVTRAPKAQRRSDAKPQEEAENAEEGAAPDMPGAGQLAQAEAAIARVDELLSEAVR
jgi:chemotaxis protein MotC